MTSSPQTSPIILRPNATKVLDGTDSVWVVESGCVSVFCATLDERRSLGPRRFLWEARAGELLLGGVAANQTLLAVALAEATIVEIAPSELVMRFADPLAPIGDLVRRLSGCWKSDLSRQPVSVKPSKPVAISAGERASGDVPGLALVRVFNGRVTLMGGSRALTPETTPLIVDRRLWLEAREPSKLQFEAVAVSPEADEMFNRHASGVRAESLDARTHAAGVAVKQSVSDRVTHLSEVLSGVRQLRDQLLEHLAEADARAVDAQARRLRMRDELVAKETVGAFDELSHAWNRDVTTSRGVSPLWSVLSVIGQEIGCTFQAAQSGKKQRTTAVNEFDQGDESANNDTLADIMRASHVRTRVVLLTKNWFRSDSGPLIGTLAQEHRPVTLLWRADRYELLDPTAGTSEPVNDEVESRLLPHAVSVIRPLPESREHSFASLLRFSLSRYRRDLFALFCLWFGLLVIIWVGPSQTKPIVNDIIPNAKVDVLAIMAVVLTIVALGQSAFSLCQRLFVVRMQAGISTDAQMAVLDRVLRLPQRFLAKYSAGDLTHRVMTVTELSADIGANALWGILGSTATLVSMLPYFLRNSLAWIPLTAIAFTMLASLRIGRHIRKLAAKVSQRESELFGFAVQMVGGVSKLRVSQAEQRAFNHWARRYTEQMRLVSEMQRHQDRLRILNVSISTLALLALFHEAADVLGTSVEISSGLASMSIGKFLVFHAAFKFALSESKSLSETAVNVLDQWAKRELVEPLLAEPLESDVSKTDPGELFGDFAIRGVSFRYRSDGPLILSNVNIEARPGEFIAVVGPSGSGKSTLLRLLFGFETPEAGSIYFDNQELAGIDATAVRRQIGVVFPNGQINNGTVYENIALGRDLTFAEAWQAVRDAGLEQEVKALPMGLHTALNEGATTFSGGQRQRLLIARALAGNPKILLFDEATSALDNRTQAHVTNSLRRRNVTRLVIAHRLSTIRDADRIYVIAQGRVVQCGTFDELMAVDGHFQRMAQRQLL